MKKVLAVVLLLLIPLMLVGCGKKNPLEGVWEYFSDGSTNNTIYYTFKDEKNGTYTFFGATKNFTYTVSDNNLEIMYEGDTEPFKTTYQIKDNILTIKDSFDEDVNYKKK